jgi:Rrf2 family transcriptional regulator, cysteine metabolism repressor
MRLSAKTEYAIKAMLDLALHASEGIVSIQAIAARQAIPQRYLEQVLLRLKGAGLLSSRRGAAGGYHLTKSPHEITVGAVLRAVEGAEPPFASVRGSRRGVADHAPELAELWKEIAMAVSTVIDRVTFGDLAARAAERRQSTRPMYHI